MKKGLMITILILVIQPLFGQQFTDLYGAYLGQSLPGDTPLVFARGIVSDSLQQHGVPAFSPNGNEVFWQTNQLGKDEKWVNFIGSTVILMGRGIILHGRKELRCESY